MLRGNTTLTELNLRGNGLKDAGSAAIADALSCHPTLGELVTNPNPNQVSAPPKLQQAPGQQGGPVVLGASCGGAHTYPNPNPNPSPNPNPNPNPNPSPSPSPSPNPNPNPNQVEINTLLLMLKKCAP